MRTIQLLAACTTNSAREFAHPHLDAAPSDAVSPTDAAAPVVPIISTPKEEKCTGYVPQPSTPPDPEGVNMRKRKGCTFVIVFLKFEQQQSMVMKVQEMM